MQLWVGPSTGTQRAMHVGGPQANKVGRRVLHNAVREVINGISLKLISWLKMGTMNANL